MMCAAGYGSAGVEQRHEFQLEPHVRKIFSCHSGRSVPQVLGVSEPVRASDIRQG